VVVLHFAILESFVRVEKEEGRNEGMKEGRERGSIRTCLFVGKSSHGNKQITWVSQYKNESKCFQILKRLHKSESIIITQHKNQHRMIEMMTMMIDAYDDEEEDGSDVDDLTERKFYLIFM
jgi:hypothetical protein